MFAALVHLLLSVPAYAQAPEDSGPSSLEQADYVVGPRDKLHVEVVGEAELTRDVVVSEDGALQMPYLAPLQVTGRSVQEVASTIADAYRGDYLVNPQVTVSVAQHRSQQVEIYGAVKKQGAYFLTKPTTLLELLGEAGGVETAKSSQQVVVRLPNGETNTVNYENLRASGTGNMILEPGTTITVQDNQVVYVAGHVEKPGAVGYHEGITVLDALIEAGGPAQTARLRGAYILRDGEQIPVNIRKIQDGKDPDVQLAPGDKLYLKESPI